MVTYMPDIESKTAHGETPLIIAVRHGKLLSVKYPLEREPILWLKITTVRILYIMPHHKTQISWTCRRVTWLTVSLQPFYVRLNLQCQNISRWFV